MADLPRAPLKLRLTRPYGTEEEFVAADAHWFGRASVTLVDAAPLPVGELVRFEVVLATGAPMLRGEGTVVAHHAAGGSKPAGLEVRFARIDARSKAVLDRVRAFRASGARGSLSVPPSAARPSGAGASLAPSALPSLAPSMPPPSSLSASSLLPAWPTRSASSPPPDRASEQSGVHVSRAARGVAAPANREEILARLRERALRLEAAGTPLFKRRDVG